MQFSKQIVYGRECYYPVNAIAKKFIQAFPNSAGKRKCLTQDQYKLLKKLGVILDKKDKKTMEKKNESNCAEIHNC